MKIGFIVDSACDLPIEFVQQYSISVVPTFVNYNGQSWADDGIHLNRQTFYKNLPEMYPLPKTSAPSPEVAKYYIDKAFAQCDHLIIVVIASRLSGVYNAMRLGMAGLSPEQVTLVDSGQLSMAAGWQVLLGAEVAAQTGDLQITLDTMQRVRENQSLYAAMQSVEYLRWGGRVNWTSATVSSLLKIRPIVKVSHNHVESIAKVRKRRVWIDMLANRVRAEAPLDRVALLHTNNLEDLETLKSQLADVLPANVITVLATPTIGTHTGPYGIGIASVWQSWKTS